MHDEVMNVDGRWLELTRSEHCAFAFARSTVSVSDARTATTCGSVFTRLSIESLELGAVVLY